MRWLQVALVPLLVLGFGTGIVQADYDWDHDLFADCTAYGTGPTDNSGNARAMGFVGFLHTGHAVVQYEAFAEVKVGDGSTFQQDTGSATQGWAQADVSGSDDNMEDGMIVVAESRASVTGVLPGDDEQQSWGPVKDTCPQSDPGDPPNPDLFGFVDCVESSLSPRDPTGPSGCVGSLGNVTG